MGILKRGQLKRIILLPFFLLIFLTFLLSWSLYIRGSRQALEETMEQLTQELFHSTTRALESYLLPVQVITQSNSVFLSENPELMNQVDPLHIPRMFHAQLLHFETPVILSVGFSDGEYREVQRYGTNGIRYGIAGKQTQGHLQFFEPSRNREDYTHDQWGSSMVPNYDPRERPWYTTAVTTGTFSWSQVYPLSSTGEPVLSAIMPLRRENQITGVTSVVMSLKGLNAFLRETLQEEQGILQISDTTGALIASSWETSHSWTNQNVERMLTRPHYSLTRRLDNPLLPQWTISISLFQDYYHAPLRRADRSTFWVMGLALAGFLLIGWQVLSRVTYPITLLSEAVIENNPETPTIDSSLLVLAKEKNELGRLAQNYIAMVSRVHKDYQRLKQNLQEKEVLLKEIHHRVKNNLQIISSLLNLQAHNLDDPKVQEAFQVSQDRIRAMAFIHENAYVSGLYSSIQMQTYFEQLTEPLLHHNQSQGTRVGITIEAQLAELPLELAIPCGLIVNEVVSNSLKHAFRNLPEGTIHIHLGIDQTNACLRISDNGVGFHTQTMQARGIGLELIQGLTEQLDGSIIWNKHQDQETGTTVEIHFPIA